MASKEAPSDRDVAVAALVAIPFILLLVGLQLGHAATADQLPHADPLVSLCNLAGVWLIPLVSVLVVAFWLRRHRPDRDSLARGMKHAALGVVVAAVIAIGLRIIVGPELPTFIPAEESAKPGITQGVAAGVIEEVVFRLALLPAALIVTRRYLPELPARLASMLIIGLSFAGSHLLGPTAGPFRGDYFATRFIMPGALMSAAYLWISPAFIVAAHCTVHLFIPFLFH